MSTTSQLINGNNISILISLLMAGSIIVLMLVMSSKSAQYAIPVSEFVPSDGKSFRLEGTFEQIDMSAHRASLCDQGICLNVVLPQNFVIQPQTRIIAEGQYHDQMLHISSILTRCSHKK